MTSITDFDNWIEMLDLEDFEEVDSLYQSVRNVSDYGEYKTIEGRSAGSYVVTASVLDVNLFLASEKARQAFLKYIESTFCEGEMEEAWYAVKRANAKDD